MPGPAASTAYGMYFDMTSWTYGVAMGTIKSSDGVLNNGNFRFDAPLTISNGVNLNLGSNGQNFIACTSVGLDTTHFSVNTSTGTNSGAFALVSESAAGNANRSPVTAHTNPNLYVYRRGVTNANDFIRVEHDGTNGNIVSGGTSGILIQPGSGVLGISGGISAAGATFSGVVKASAGVLTDSVVPLVGLGGGGILYLNTAETTGGGGTRTWIGDVNQETNGTYIIVDDIAAEMSISGPAIHFYGAVNTNSTVTIANTVTVQAGGAVLEWDGSLPAPTVLTVYNQLTPANTLTLSGQGVFSTLNTNGTLQYGAASGYADAFSITTATTGVTTMGSWTKTAYRSFEFDIQGSKGTTGPYQFTKIVAVHDGTTVTSTQLSNISTGLTLASYLVDISGTLVRLRVTPGATTSTAFKTIVKAIPV